MSLEPITVKIEEETLYKFDRILLELKYREDIGESTTRSEVARDLIEEWVDEHEHLLDESPFDGE